MKEYLDAVPTTASLPDAVGIGLVILCIVAIVATFGPLWYRLRKGK